MLSDRDVERLLSNLEIKSCATRDQQEVAGYAELMDVVFSSWQDIPFTENHIKQLYQVLLRYSEKDAWHRGDYKTHSNSVAACDETGAQKGTIRTGSPDWQPWLVFFLRSLAEQVWRLEKKIERERIVLATLPTLQLQIVEFAREHGRVTIGEAIRLTGASRNTLKQHFRSLVERGTLDQHGGGRGVWYGLR